MTYEEAKIQQVVSGGHRKDMLPCITHRGDKFLARVEYHQDKFIRRTFGTERQAYNWQLVQKTNIAAL